MKVWGLNAEAGKGINVVEAGVSGAKDAKHTARAPDLNWSSSEKQQSTKILARDHSSTLRSLSSAVGMSLENCIKPHH